MTADFLAGYPFMLAEAASLIGDAFSLLVLSRTIDRSAHVTVPSAPRREAVIGRHPAGSTGQQLNRT
ncbi:hypothetical protein JQ615_36320 [Bradyrhizobium jicamae]|uniref:Uncharacterized protein n=1 Tax=Bradyrhizobium jicamae TaxID=280332 RepID=A0ABS5FVI0_9BRAD|nr:hypothetical protein [Bradyrhizobium jicamae]MBR0800842.1 hypothetical protein [Bradyrhizobium jicamae]